MAQRQFKTGDTDVWNDGFGNGSDGVYSPSTSTDAPIDSACTGTIATTALSATNAGFIAGQLLLIHQTRGSGVGAWELNKVLSYVVGTITLAYPLQNNYVSGAQVLVMSQFSSGNIGGGVTITGKSWNGTVGGIYAKFCNGAFTIAGNLTVRGNNSGSAGVGFGGGVFSTAADNTTGMSGEGSAGGSLQQKTANGNGGGAGRKSAGNVGSGGGGGGYAVAGNGGANGGAESGGSGGNAVGLANLTTLFFGGGGGSSADSGAGPADGGSGGGLVLLITDSITITGTINSDGGTGQNAGSGSGGSAGGGAGGSILLKGKNIILGTTLVTAISGPGGGTAPAGGAGSAGRIHADYLTSVTGTTSPTLDSTQDNILGAIATTNYLRQYRRSRFPGSITGI